MFFRRDLDARRQHYFTRSAFNIGSMAHANALAYAGYAEIVVTAIVVNTMMICKCLKQGVKVVPDWYSE